MEEQGDKHVLTARFAALPERQRALLALCLDAGCSLATATDALELSFAEAQEEIRRALLALNLKNTEIGWTELSALSASAGTVTATGALCAALDAQVSGARCERIAAEAPGAISYAELLGGRRSAAQWWRMIPAAAAVLALAALGIALHFRNDSEAPGVQVLSGRVRYNGSEAEFVPNGQWLENAGDTPAVMRLADGTRVTLKPAGVLRASGKSGAGLAVEVDSGTATFLCPERGGRLSVRTAVGEVNAVNGEFTVELKERDEQPWEGDTEMSKQDVMALTLAVVAGTVSVRFDGDEFQVSAGGSRVFAAEGKVADKGDPALKGEKVDKGGGKVEKPGPIDVALEDVPEAIKAAAEAMVPGIALSSAQIQPGSEYRLDGEKGGVEYEIRIAAFKRKPKGGGGGDGAPKVKGDNTNPKAEWLKKQAAENNGDPAVKGDKNVKGEGEPKKIIKGGDDFNPKVKGEKNIKGDPDTGKKIIKGDTGAGTKGDKSVIKGDGGEEIKGTKGVDKGAPQVKKGTKDPNVTKDPETTKEF
jgi:hypothetical protein